MFEDFVIFVQVARQNFAEYSKFKITLCLVEMFGI